jgi:hypothetical protein
LVIGRHGLGDNRLILKLFSEEEEEKEEEEDRKRSRGGVFGI